MSLMSAHDDDVWRRSRRLEASLPVLTAGIKPGAGHLDDGLRPESSPAIRRHCWRVHMVVHYLGRNSLRRLRWCCHCPRPHWRDGRAEQMPTGCTRVWAAVHVPHSQRRWDCVEHSPDDAFASALAFALAIWDIADITGTDWLPTRLWPHASIRWLSLDGEHESSFVASNGTVRCLLRMWLSTGGGGGGGIGLSELLLMLSLCCT